MRFGRLVVVERAASCSAGARWTAICDCGGQTTTTGTKLRSGYTKSCGCLPAESLGARRYKHGASNGYGQRKEARLYRIWGLMKNRCRDPKNNRYYCYGARGISVCSQWSGDFLAFQTWALANGYAEHLTIDRIDNDGNYEPSNCRWLSMPEQMKNRSKKYRAKTPA